MRPTMNTYPASPDLPVRYVREIGRIIVRWAYFENYVQRTIYDLLQISQKLGRVAVREPQIKLRLEIITNLALLRDVALDKDQFAVFRTEAEELATFRNYLAHGIWTFNKERGLWAVQVTRGGWEGVPKTDPMKSKILYPEGLLLDTDSLRDVIARINAVQKTAEAIRSGVQAQLRSGQSQQPTR